MEPGQPRQRIEDRAPIAGRILLVLTRALVVSAGLGAIGGCADPAEAPRVDLPVVVDARDLTAQETDLGFTIEIGSLRVSLRDLRFTIAGELHARAPRTFWERVVEVVSIPTARAHPGHFQGGEVTGELAGAFAFDWVTDAGQAIGEATLISGRYRGANVILRGPEGEPDALAGEDAAATIRGVARRGEDSHPFIITIRLDADAEIVGLPFEATISPEAEGALHFAFTTWDPLGGRGFFDGIAFDALAGDAGEVTLSPEATGAGAEAYALVRARLASHDFMIVRFVAERP